MVHTKYGNKKSKTLFATTVLIYFSGNIKLKMN